MEEWLYNASHESLVEEGYAGAKLDTCPLFQPSALAVTKPGQDHSRVLDGIGFDGKGKLWYTGST